MTSPCDEIIINELLCFVQCKVNVMDEISLLQICESNFSDAEVEKAKEIISKTLELRLTRKGEGKKKRILQDLITAIKEKDPSQLPVFVAKDLHRLPPVTFDHVDATTLLKDILLLKQDVQAIKSDYVRSTTIKELREQISNTRHTEIKETPELRSAEFKKPEELFCGQKNNKGKKSVTNNFKSKNSKNTGTRVSDENSVTVLAGARPRDANPQSSYAAAAAASHARE